MNAIIYKPAAQVVFEYLKDHPSLTSRELCEQIDLPEQRISGALHELFRKKMIDRTDTPAPTGAYGRNMVYRYWTISDQYIRKPMNVPRPRKPKELKAQVEDFKNKTTELLNSWTVNQAREVKDILFAPPAPVQTDPVEIIKGMTVYQARDLYTHLKEVFGH